MKKMDLFQKAEIISATQLNFIQGGSRHHDEGDSRHHDIGSSIHHDIGESRHHDTQL